MLTFDKLKLVADVEAIQILDADKFEKIEQAGKQPSLRFYQEEPYLLLIKIDYDAREVVIEFCGKVLGCDYPKLISADTIRTCFNNINALGVCFIDVEAMMDADVVKADVTKDIREVDTQVLTTYLRSHISNYKSFLCRLLRNGNLVIEKNVTSRKTKKRMTIYDKEKEMGKAQNRDFVVSNNLEHAFDNTCRIELNLNSRQQVRTTLNLTNNKLKNVLASTANPILDFMNLVIEPSSTPVVLTDKKTYVTMLVLKDCDYDLEKVEAKMRELYPSRGTNFRKIMEPYRIMLDQLNNNTSAGSSIYRNLLESLA